MKLICITCKKIYEPTNSWTALAYCSVECIEKEEKEREMNIKKFKGHL